MYGYVCKKCGTEFQSPKKGKKYCSHECFAHRFDPVTKTCETCGCEFTVAYRFRGQKTCGKECAKSVISKTLNAREVKQCLACGKDFEVVQSYKDDAKYCSYECFLSTRATRQPNVTKVCEYCDQEFVVPFVKNNRRFCNKSCANSGENNGSFGLTGSLHPTSNVSSWNKGKTKYDDSRLRMLGEKISTIIADKIVSGTWSPPSTGFKGEHYTGIKNGGEEVYLRSSFESAVARSLDEDDDVVSWVHEPFRLPYMFDGSIHNYVPDFLVFFRDCTELWEVKPKMLTETVQNIAKREVATAWCTSNKTTYRDVTEDDIGLLSC